MIFNNTIVKTGGGVTPSGTMNITANGTYDVASYAAASVSVPVSGITVDQIAQKTVSGLITGSASTILSYAFYQYSHITAASFPSVSTIGSSAFAYCNRLQTVSFPAAKDISGFAFQGCASLINVYAPSLAWVRGSVFSYCTALKSVSFPIASHIQASAFNSCSALETVYIPSAQNISANAFVNCTALKSVDFPLVKSVYGSAFRVCIELSIVSFSASLISISAVAFSTCRKLIELHLENVTSVPGLGANVFYSTPIGGYSTSAGRYGSIFVPASLYASFQTATNWASVSARMVSV